MAAFRFSAIDDTGKAHKGVMQAVSAAAARTTLRGCGLLPIELVASGAEGTSALAKAPKASRSTRMPLSALKLVTRQMATLLGSGLRIDEALTTIASGQPPKVAGVLLTVRETVQEGRSFADALARYPQIFTEFYRATVRAGETSGKLDQVMAHLASHVENRARNRQSVQLALLYPALLAIVSFAIITLLMAYVVPDIVKVFRDRGADLPLLTRVLIGISGAMRAYGMFAVILLLLAGLAFARWLRRPANRLRFDAMLAQGRMTRRFVQRMNAAQFAGTLATLLLSQVPLVDAMAAAADVTPNMFVRGRVAGAADKVRQGVSLQRALHEAAVFPAMLVAMVASGEATGRLGQSLDHAATDQQRDLDAWVKAVVALVEPAILIVMGGLVMAMVLAILLPIVSLNGLAQ